MQRFRQARVPVLTEADHERASPARIYDYWLGGDHHFPVDRVVGGRIAAALPTLMPAVYANRAFLARVVRHLVARGITQFIDLGSGIPTEGNVHEIAEECDPSCRVVYVDNDPVAFSHSQQLLDGNPQATVINADLRDAAAVLGHPDTRDLLDLGAPFAVLMIAVLHFIPDSDRPAAIIGAYRDAMVPGSYLALSHSAPDRALAREQAVTEGDYISAVGVDVVSRTPDQLGTWLDGFELQEPGIVLVNQWNTDPEDEVIFDIFGLLARRTG